MNKLNTTLLRFFLLALVFIQHFGLTANNHLPDYLACALIADAGQDQEICNPGQTINLSGFVSDPLATYQWTPTTGLSNPFSLNPTATVFTTTTYTLDAQLVDATNLVINGNFNAGAVGFSSDYIPGTGGPFGLLSNEGQYAVSNNPALTHNNFSACMDHTGDAVGNMMVINGASVANQNVWCQTVSVTAGTDYEFGAWVAMVINSSPAILQFSINGMLIGNIFNAPSATCAWTPFTANWNSGSNTSAQICIVNLNTNPSGNDFALDDITFNEVCTATDEVTITVNQNINSFVTETVCPNNNCVIVNGVPYCGAGPYVINLMTAQGCDSTVFLDIIENDPNIVIPPLDLITCNNGTVAINPFVDTQGGTVVNSQWFGPNGFLSNDLDIIAPYAGGYLLEIDVELNGTICQATTTAIVDENLGFPVADAGQNITLECGETFPVLLDASNSTLGPNISYQWSGPGVSVTDIAILVYQAGVYSLVVTDIDNGCQSSASVIVTEGGNLPEISPVGGLINCHADSIQLDGESMTPNVTYLWTGPNGFMDTIPDPLVGVNGTYYLTISAGIDCMVDDSVMVTIDTIAPEPLVQGGTLTCSAMSIPIAVTNPDTSLTYTWSGPGGFSAVGDTIDVTAVGDYEVTAIAANGCENVATAAVLADANLPNAQATGGIINCNNNSIQLAGSSTTANVVIGWTGPNGFVSAIANPMITDIGEYIFSVAAPNGCISTIPVQVTADLAAPDLSIADVEISCADTSIMLEATTTTGVLYNWTGPNGFMSSELNPEVTEPGTYNLEVIGLNGCDTTAALLVNQSTLIPDISATGGIIDCDQTDLMLIGNSTTPNVTYSWTGPNGFTSTDASPVVSEAGTYELTVMTLGGCMASAMAQVTSDGSLPDVSATGGIIDCDQTDLMLVGNSTTPNVTYSWTGPNGFTSTDASPVVSEAGTYELTVMTLGGCMASAMAQVTSDGSLPDVSATGGIIDCDQTDLMLVGNSTTPNVTYSWTGPNGFMSTDASPIVSEAGTYELTVMTMGGCMASAMAQVTSDGSPPDVTATGGIIDCDQNDLMLIGNSSNPNITYSWTGPNGFSSDQASPVVSVLGTYELTVSTTGGCEAMDTALVVADAALPDITASGGTIFCDPSEIQIQGASATPNVSWTGPNGFISTEDNPTVNEAGNYTLTVSAANGCMSFENATVFLDTIIPALTALGEDLDCAAQDAQLSFNAPTALSFIWTGPNGYSSTTEDPIVTESGSYQIVVTGPNGCENSALINVGPSGNIPDLLVSGGQLDCDNPDLNLNATSTDPTIAAYNWIGPNGFLSSEAAPLINQPGDYFVTITNAAGCENMGMTNISQDGGLPIFSLERFYTLDCNFPDLNLLLNLDDPTQVVSWTGPNGFNSTDIQPLISEPGDYEVTITAANGCEAIAEASVFMNFSTPSFTVFQTEITCTNPIAQMEVIVFGTNITAEWQGVAPVAATNNGLSASTTIVGNYSVTVTGSNGCTSTENIEITGATDIPLVNIDNLFLDCNNPDGILNYQSSIPLLNINWNGPNGFTSSDQMPVVSEAGLYSISGLTSDGCPGTAELVIQGDFTPPVINSSASQINCLDPTSDIIALVSDPAITISWTGPNGYTAIGPMQSVATIGDYIATATSTNGCTETSLVTVTADNNVPVLNITGGGINCLIPQTLLAASVDLPGGNYSWMFNNNVVSSTDNFLATAGGNYTVSYNLPNGCVATEVINVPEDFIEPTVVVGDGFINCTNTNFTLTPMTNDLITNWEWSGPNGFSSQDEMPVVAEGGTYNLTSTAINGCNTHVVINVFADQVDPDFTSSGGVVDCNNPEIALQAIGSNATNFDFEWTGPNSFNSNDQNPSVSVGGLYDVLITGANGCTQMLFALVDVDTLLPNFSLDGGILTCIEDNILLSPTDLITGSYQWTGPNGFASQDQMINVTVPGEYNLVITPDNGCENEQFAMVLGDQEDPVLIVEDGHLSCAENEIILLAQSDVNGTASWTGPNNFTADILTPMVQESGVYALSFTSSQNGCTETASLQITADDPLLSGFESEDPNCPGESGNFIFNNTVGGVAPYVYSIDGGETFNNETPEGALAVGNYNFVVQDAGECHWDTTIVIEPAPIYFVQLNSEVEIDYGDEVQLSPNLNFPNTQIQSINWSPAIGLSCTDCLSPMANPFQDTRYEVTITTNGGCVTAASIIFKVNNDKDLFIPNVFSPNNDGNNDAFTVFGNEERIERVNEMIIVDRWGEIVYRAENFPINDFSFGWDGIFRGEKMNAGVFVYHLQVLWKDGSTDWFKGDVTLMR